MSRRRKTQDSRKKKNTENSNKKSQSCRQQEQEAEYRNQWEEFIREFARERYHPGAQNRSGTSRSKFDEHEINSKAWDRYVDEELALYVGQRDFDLLVTTFFLMCLTLGTFFGFIAIGKFWNFIFRSNSHWYGVLFTLIYILCCINTSFGLVHHSVNYQSYVFVVQKGLPLLRNSHEVYYHTSPSNRVPSKMRNPFDSESHLIYFLRYNGLRFLYSYAFSLFYAPFVMFYALARYYDTFPSQWPTIAGALGVFYVVSWLSNGREEDAEKLRAGNRGRDFFEFWGGLGLVPSF